ncbi:MAG: redox-sensing transcriptional repressor Rex [Bacteroidota bacterium]
MKKLPEKTVERLSQYRRVLITCVEEGKQHIFSHELAILLHIKPVQVRRDIMLISHTGTLRKGYDIKELIDLIGRLLDSPETQNVIVVGMGNLGRAITSYFNGKRSKLAIVATFDTDENKVNRIVSGVHCYHTNQMAEYIQKEKVRIGIIAVPPEYAAKVAEELVLAGIKGILNYTSTSLNVSNHVYLEEYDMITSLEKVAFFSKK